MRDNDIISSAYKGTIDTDWPTVLTPMLIKDRDPMLSADIYKALFGKTFVPSIHKSEWVEKDDECFYPVINWISKEFPLRCTTLLKQPHEQIINWEAKLGKGVYLMFSPKSPLSDNLDLDALDWSVLYLNLLWRDRDEFDGSCNPIWATRSFLNHLHAMPENPIRAVYLRPMDVCKHYGCSYLMKALPMITSNTSSRERLARVYRRAWGTVETLMADCSGKPYHRVDWWNPPRPAEHENQFEWPDLLKNAN